MSMKWQTLFSSKKKKKKKKKKNKKGKSIPICRLQISLWECLNVNKLHGAAGWFKDGEVG